MWYNSRVVKMVIGMIRESLFGEVKGTFVRRSRMIKDTGKARFSHAFHTRLVCLELSFRNNMGHN